MTLTSRRLRIAGAAGLGALLIVGALSYLNREPTAPATQQQAAVAWPIEPDQSPPKVEAQQPKPVQVAQGERQDYIVQAASTDLARRAVEKAGGRITGDLDIIRAVGASLDAMELSRLHENPVDGLRVYEDAAVSASATSALPETYYPQEVGATTLHKGGLTGRGVTVAVLDSGLWHEKGPLQKTSHGSQRVLAQYDAIQARANPTNYDDAFGHGTHIPRSSPARRREHRSYQGVAPGVNLVSVKALNDNGAGRYFDVIRGIQWIVANKSRYGIRVHESVAERAGALALLGRSVEPGGHDCVGLGHRRRGLPRATKARRRCRSACRATTRTSSPSVRSRTAIVRCEPDQYRLASFSSAGPTFEGFVKPEVVAMGGHIRAYSPNNGTLARNYPQWVDSRFNDFTMSGTSQAAAVTSGVVALMLESNPNLTPDQVKCRLMDSARPAVRTRRHARVLGVPAGRRPRQRSGCGVQQRQRLRQRRSRCRCSTSPASSISAAARIRTPTATSTSWRCRELCAQDFAPWRSAGWLGRPGRRARRNAEQRAAARQSADRRRHAARR